MNRYQVMNWSAGREKRRKYDIINQENERMNGTGKSSLTAGQLRAYFKFEESAGPPAIAEEWRGQRAGFHQGSGVNKGV